MACEYSSTEENTLRSTYLTVGSLLLRRVRIPRWRRRSRRCADMDEHRRPNRVSSPSLPPRLLAPQHAHPSSIITHPKEGKLLPGRGMQKRRGSNPIGEVGILPGRPVGGRSACRFRLGQTQFARSWTLCLPGMGGPGSFDLGGG